MSDEELAGWLARHLKALREARGAPQAQLAKLAGVPRATWANLESGASNPTLSVLHRVAGALQVSLEELVARPRASARHYPKESLPRACGGRASCASCCRTRCPESSSTGWSSPPRRD